MNRSKGFGLLELMIVLVIASLLLTIAVPAYDGHTQRARIARAVGEIGTIAIEIERLRLKNLDRDPDSLAESDIQISLDPWGEPYQYLNIVNAGPGVEALRKDGMPNPLNTDFDLYSMGKDRDSKGPPSAKASRDDIVRANNGAFIGLGEDY
jgi:general secretion pathway protein G